ncbi:MAG: Translation elongation factor Tu, partial [uncultured Thermomicrobiales bacterium]
GQAEVRAVEAARERGHDRACRSWQDDLDGGDLQDAGDAGGRAVPGLRLHRQCAGGAGAGHHDRDQPRRVRDAGAALCARGLPGARRLHQEHDHRGGPDGRGDPGRERPGRPDAADARAHPAGAAGPGAEHRGLPEQGRHDGR